MAQPRQTSVRISVRAREVLSWIAQDRGVSRDQAARELLHEHVTAQAARPQEQRLTHISTVLRFPPPRPGRESDGRVRLAVRLDEDVAARACAMALRLPGQAARRGYRDYGARPLTDALAAAIARVRPFVDDGLEGLPPLLTHRQALGLWRLTVAATLTRAEERALFGSSPGDVAVVLREEDVAWHAPWRFAMARHLAQQLLAGPDAETHLAMLWNQTGDFDLLRSDLERSDGLHHRLLAGAPLPKQDLQGRGGSAVWRAQRTLALDALGRWLAKPNPGQATTDPPGWTLLAPPGWHGLTADRTAQLPAQQQADLDAGRVLRVAAGRRSVLWPYDTAGQPIGGFDAVLAGARDLAPAELVELVLVTTDQLESHPVVPPQTAHDLGFLSATDRDHLVTDAATRNRREVADVLRRASRLSQDHREALQAAAGDPERFARLARRLRLRCYLHRPVWTWHVDSIAAALVAGAAAAHLQCLTGAMRQSQLRALERSMERAWREAFWLGGTVVDDDV